MTVLKMQKYMKPEFPFYNLRQLVTGICAVSSCHLELLKTEGVEKAFGYQRNRLKSALPPHTSRPIRSPRLGL